MIFSHPYLSRPVFVNVRWPMMDGNACVRLADMVRVWMSPRREFFYFTIPQMGPNRE